MRQRRIPSDFRYSLTGPVNPLALAQLFKFLPQRMKEVFCMAGNYMPQ
jgi:hypothetical protein